MEKKGSYLLKLGILDDMGKVLFENRNVVINPLKSGKAGDVYFTNILVEDKNVQAKIKQGTINDYNEKIAKVKKSKENKDYKANFFPASVKHFPD